MTAPGIKAGTKYSANCAPIPNQKYLKTISGTNKDIVKRTSDKEDRKGDV